MRGRCLATLAIMACAAATRVQAAGPGVAVSLWVSDRDGGESQERFLPGRELFFHAAAVASGMRADTPVRISLALEGPRGWRSELKPDVRAKVGRLEPSYSRSYRFSEALPPYMFGRHDLIARVECGDAPAVQTSVRFSIEPPVVLEKVWVDRLPLALPRTESNRLMVGQKFYFHARHSISDLVDAEKAELTVEWNVLRGEKLLPLSASVTKPLDADPQQRLLTRAVCDKPPGSEMVGAFNLRCTARLGEFHTEPLVAPFIIIASQALAAPDVASASLVSIAARPRVVRPGKRVSLLAKYKVTGLIPGERAALIERQLVSSAGREWVLPMRSVERANGFYVISEKFTAPEDAAPGEYCYEFSLLAPQRSLCRGEACFNVQPLVITSSNLSIWPKKVKPGDQVTLSFRFDVRGLAEGEAMPVERVISIKGPRALTLKRAGWLRQIPGAVYRTRDTVSVPADWPAGHYDVSAIVTCPDAHATAASGSFDITPQ